MERDGTENLSESLKGTLARSRRPGPDDCTTAHIVNRNKTSNPNPPAPPLDCATPPHQEYARLGSGGG